MEFSGIAENLSFKAADYVVWVVIIAFSLGIGVYYACSGGRQRTTEEFLVADRSMNPIPVALSISVSFISAVTFLGTTSETYTNGVMIWLHVVAILLACLGTGVFFLPVFHRLQITSTNEYLERRFSKATRRLGTIMVIINTFVYMGVVLYGPALALNQVAGLNVWGSVLTIGLACTFYTSIGGLKAVIWTDVFQMLIMMSGLLAVIIRGSAEVGGFTRVLEIANRGERLDLFDMRTDVTIRHTFWGLSFGMAFMFLSMFGTNQTQVQRYLSCQTKKNALIALSLGTFFTSIFVSSAVAAGLVMYAFYADCDPLSLGLVGKKDQMIPFFTMELFQDSPGLPGLFLSAVFSASLSSISSGLNSISAVTTEDIIKPCLPGRSDLRYTQISKLVAAGYGLLVIAFAFLASVLGSILQTAIKLISIFGGPTLGLFSAGMFLPWVNSKGAFGGTITGLAISFWIGIGAQFNPTPYPTPPVSTSGCESWYMYLNATRTEYMTLLNATTEGAIDASSCIGYPEAGPSVLKIYSLSYTWYAAVSWLVTMVAALLISFLTGPSDPRKLDPRLICPVVDAMYCCLPEKWKIPLRCGVGEDFDEREKNADYQKEKVGDAGYHVVEMQPYNAEDLDKRDDVGHGGDRHRGGRDGDYRRIDDDDRDDGYDHEKRVGGKNTSGKDYARFEGNDTQNGTHV